MSAGCSHRRIEHDPLGFDVRDVDPSHSPNVEAESQSRQPNAACQRAAAFDKVENAVGRPVVVKKFGGAAKSLGAAKRALAGPERSGGHDHTQDAGGDVVHLPRDHPLGRQSRNGAQSLHIRRDRRLRNGNRLLGQICF